MKARSLRAALTWTGDRFEAGVRIEIAPDGTIDSMRPDPSPVDLDLVDEALLPGMINAHSHSFQRALRGRTERFPSGKGSFWTWRQNMYEMVERLDEQEMYDWNLAAFTEMRHCGITSVGEFHYLHHASRHENDHRLDRVVLDAARAAGIRIVLLQAYYRTGGIGEPLSDSQRRFATPSVGHYLKSLDELGKTLGPNQSLGIVAHSIRAVPVEDLVHLASEAVRRDMPFHMHLEEQLREIEDCETALGARPTRIVLDRTDVDHRFTGIHCTHTREEDFREWISRGANVCITPLTEGNLGDGVQPLADAAIGQLSVGTDCNARIDLLEEIRWLEYEQRLRREDRGVFRDAEGRNGKVLFDVATVGGARALGTKAGRIAAGSPADFFTVNLRHPTLRGWEEETLLDALVFSGGSEIIRRNCVGGDFLDP